MAINRAGIKFLKPIKFWATYHPITMLKEDWRGQRLKMGGNMNFTVVAEQRCSGIDNQPIPGPSVSGSSSLYGALVALSFGYRRVVIAGAPLSDPRYNIFRLGWRMVEGQLKGRVTSLSGWTRDFLSGGLCGA